MMNILKTSLLTAFILMTEVALWLILALRRTQRRLLLAPVPQEQNGPKCPTQSACEKYYSTTCYNIGGEEGEAIGVHAWKSFGLRWRLKRCMTCFNACHISCGS